MKKDNLIIITFLFIVFLIFRKSNETKIEEQSEQATTTSLLESATGTLPSEAKLSPIRASVFKFVFSYKDTVGHSTNSHCTLYANRSDMSYLALSGHAFDTTKNYQIEIIDAKGKKIKLNVIDYIFSKKYDAVMLVVDRIEAPAISNSELIAFNKTIGEKTTLLSIFNPRGIKKKSGILIEGNGMAFGSVLSETGDSGSLIVGNDGVIGMSYNLRKDRRVASYVPMSEFELMYIEATLNKK